MKHRWSGWPGAWCLDCGCEDANETALADGTYDFDNPNGLNGDCPEPGSKRHDPYARAESNASVNRRTGNEGEIA